jgi:hypothetical protein
MFDDVRGTIVGPVTTQQYCTFHDKQTGEQLVGGKWFDDDKHAVAWLRENWPTLYKRGVEMRVHP